MTFGEQFNFFWQYVKPRKKALVILSVSAVIAALADALTPYFFGKLIDSGLHHAVFFGLSFWQIVLVWLAITLVALFLSQHNSFCTVLEEVNVEKNFIIQFCSHALKLPVSYHYNQKPGEVLNIIDRTTSAINIILEMLFMNSMPQVLTMLIGFIIMFAVNWLLSLIMLLSVIIFLYVSITYKMNAIIKGQRRINELYTKLYGHMGDILSNVFAVKTNTAEETENAQQQKSYVTIYKAVRNQMLLWYKQGIAQGLISRLSRISVFVFAVYLFTLHQLSEGNLVMFVGYMALVYGPLYMLTNNIRMLRRYLTDIQQALKAEKELEEMDSPNAIAVQLKGDVEFKDVSFKYPEREENIMNKVSFHVKPGETLAIFGESGSGKTTLHNLFVRLFDVDSGKILFDGIDVRQITKESLRKQIAVVPQDPALFNESIEYNIKYGNFEATHEQVVKAAKIANIHEFIESLPEKYESKVGERGIKLSGGQVQRIAIARAAIRNPKILILDEATSSLDQKTKFEVLGALQKLIEGRTAIIVTHDFSAITQSADQIIVLSQGSIVQQGTHEQLVAKPGIYRDLWQMQQKHLAANL
jgi:ABC-type multidrug transport system fused ATPase/permease subunit